MTKQINITHLEDAMIRAKQYVDDQATANVIRTETTLWSGYQIYPTTANTPISTQMVTATNAYRTMFGQTTGGIALSDRLDNYDEIEVGINRVVTDNGVSTNYGNTTHTFPVSDIIDNVNNRYRVCLFEWYGDAISTNDKAYAYFGCQDHNKLGVHIVLSGANDSWHITYVKGIKYAQGGGGGDQGLQSVLAVGNAATNQIHLRQKGIDDSSVQTRIAPTQTIISGTYDNTSSTAGIAASSGNSSLQLYHTDTSQTPNVSSSFNLQVRATGNKTSLTMSDDVKSAFNSALGVSDAVKQYVDNQATSQVIRTETLLYSASDTSRPNIITLSAPATDFDELLVEVVIAPGTTVGEGTQSTILYKVPDLIDGKTNIGNAFYSNNTAWLIWYTYTNPTTLTYLTYAGNMYINKIYGSKFTVPETYSTNEQIVGTWIDGKPIYQRTFTDTIPTTEADWAVWKDIASWNIDSLVKTKMTWDNLGNLVAADGPLTWSTERYFNIAYNGSSDPGKLYYCLIDQHPTAKMAGQPITVTIQYTKTGGV